MTFAHTYPQRTSLPTGILLPTRKYFELPKLWVKSLEESSSVDLCECNISSITTLDWHWTPNKHPPSINEGSHTPLINLLSALYPYPDHGNTERYSHPAICQVNTKCPTAYTRINAGCTSRITECLRPYHSCLWQGVGGNGSGHTAASRMLWKNCPSIRNGPAASYKFRGRGNWCWLSRHFVLSFLTILSRRFTYIGGLG
jgi:hypothetical protein